MCWVTTSSAKQPVLLFYAIKAEIAKVRAAASAKLSAKCQENSVHSQAFRLRRLSSQETKAQDRRLGPETRHVARAAVQRNPRP